MLAVPCVDSIRALQSDTTDTINTYLTKSGLVVKPPKGAAFALNMVCHLFVLFSTASILYTGVITPDLTSMYQSLVDSTVTNAMNNLLDKLAVTEKDKNDLERAVPILEELKQKYLKPDSSQKTFNSMLLGFMWMFVIFIAIVFACVSGTIAASKIKISSDIVHILEENALIFVVALLVELLFYKLLSSKYVPVLPSNIQKSIHEGFKTSFASSNT